MAQVLTFLDASEILSVLTMPLCKEWHQSYGSNQDLWKTMCLLEPFKATLPDDSDSDDDESFTSLPMEPAVKNVFGEYRLMFTSFVRCLRYLERIQQDARNGLTPTSSDNSQSGFPHFGISKSLKRFLQRKNDVFGNIDDTPAEAAAPIQTKPVGVTDIGYRKVGSWLLLFVALCRRMPHSPCVRLYSQRAAPSEESMNKKPRFGNSMITGRLLGPSSKGEPSHLQLPRSCAIYSIVNWMVAYPDVEGIQVCNEGFVCSNCSVWVGLLIYVFCIVSQIRCVETLPVLLEDESQRLLAQRVGLVEVVLRAMLRFSDCPKLHVAAFHAMVLLARPLGGREGMLFDNSMAESTSNVDLMADSQSTIHRTSAPLDCKKSSRLNGLSGINIMLDSMRRFQDKSDLQAMACWALVNLALVPAQKSMILGLGGINVALNAMRAHPADANVQFRALFALINLVVAPKTAIHTVLDSSIDQIATLVVRAMTNFCSSGAVLNRACLVLHNLAQRPDYLTILLWTPHCYQMIEWCLSNYPTDPVLKRASTSILHRLQVLLASDQRLRERFTASLQSQELTLPRVVSSSETAVTV